MDGFFDIGKAKIRRKEPYEKMFVNPGSKLIVASKILFIIGTFLALIWGISVFDDWHNMWILSIIIWIGVPAALYVNSLFLCAVGEIAEKDKE